MDFLKFVTVEELFGKKPKERKLSFWRYIDILLCFLLAFPMSMIGLAYSYYNTIWLISMSLLFILWLAKPLYDKNRLTPKWLLYVTGILRTVMYGIAVIAILLPQTMGLDWKWYYPVQRSVYLSNYEKGCFLESFLPETVPLDAEEYQVTFIPKMLQGEATVEISFYTNSEMLCDYIAHAASQNAQCHDISSTNAQKWKNWLIENYIEDSGAVVYEFDGSGAYTPVYIINEKTGYIRMYY